VGTSAAVILKVSIGLAILYGAVILVWYELLRSTVLRRRPRRGDGDAAPAPVKDAPQAAEAGGHKSEDPRRRAAMESELERVRRHYDLARQEARKERDAAIAAANQAAEEAIERIERRYREIDAGFSDEETERILEMVRRPSGEHGP
jgi:hypothetical protein